MLRQIKVFIAALLAAKLAASCASRPSAHTSATIERAKSFMASYAEELRNGNRVALAARYHPDGSHILSETVKRPLRHIMRLSRSIFPNGNSRKDSNGKICRLNPLALGQLL